MLDAKSECSTLKTRLWDALLEQNTAILGHTADFDSLSLNELDGTLLSPKSVIDVIGDNDIFYHAWVAIRRVINEEPGNFGLILAHSMEQFMVELGLVIHDRVPGPHLTYLDPRFCNDTRKLVAQAIRLVRRFEDCGVSKNDVAFSIPATESGIRAAYELERQHGIQVNLTLVTGVMHAAACAEAGASTITMFVKPLMKWHEKKRGNQMGNKTCKETIQATQAYFRLHNIKSKLVGTDFRSMDELAQLSDFDAVALTQSQINQCSWSTHLLTPISSKSPAWLRASQAQYPTTYLSNPQEKDSGFSSAMSPCTLDMVDSILSGWLAKSGMKMVKLQSIFAAEVKRQVGLEMLDLGKVYRLLEAQGKKPKDCEALAEEVTDLIDEVVELQREAQTLSLTLRKVQKQQEKEQEKDQKSIYYF